MSVFKIPEQNQIRQVGRSETLGELNESFSVDINNPFGKIKTSYVLTPVLDETDTSGAEIEALAVYGGEYWSVTADDVFRCDTTDNPNTNSNWSVET